MTLYIKDTIIWRIFIILLIIINGVAGAIFCRALIGDGSGYFFRILINKNYFLHENRFLSQMIFETPLVLAIKLGQNNLDSLLKIFSFSIIGAPVLFWLIALGLQFKTKFFWPLLLGYCVTYLASGYNSIGEYNIAYSLTAMSASILMRQDIGIKLSVLLIFASIILVFSYETTLLLGPFLLLMIFFLKQNKDQLYQKLKFFLMTAGVFLIGATFVGMRGVLYPRDASNLSAALNPASTFLNLNLACIISFLIIILLDSFNFTKVSALKTSILVGGVYVSFVFISPYALFNYNFRILSSVLLVLSLSIVPFEFMISNFRCISYKKILYHSMMPPIIIMFLSQSAASFISDIKYNIWLKKFEIVANNATGWVALDSISSNDYQFTFGWTNPILSIILRGNSSGGILNNKGVSYEPFDPLEIKEDLLLGYKKNHPFF